ncbi:MAG: transposase [Gemmatimonadales bacterium]|nr:transposase [Gemmatimonadales bacterium]
MRLLPPAKTFNKRPNFEWASPIILRVLHPWCHGFGSYLNSHIHYHVLVTDGVFSAGQDDDFEFHPSLDLVILPSTRYTMPVCDIEEKKMYLLIIK